MLPLVLRLLLSRCKWPIPTRPLLDVLLLIRRQSFRVVSSSVSLSLDNVITSIVLIRSLVSLNMMTISIGAVILVTACVGCAIFRYCL